MRPRPEPAGPGGKYLGRTGPMTVPELRAALAEVREQVGREGVVLDELADAILTRDLTTTTAVLMHLRDLFMVIGALLDVVRVDEEPAP